MDWIVDFSEAKSDERSQLLESAFGSVISDNLDMDECEFAIAAAFIVASQIEGGPSLEEEVGLDDIYDIGGEVSTSLRGQASAALTAVMSESSEWTELWSESGEVDEKRSIIERLKSVLDGF